MRRILQFGIREEYPQYVKEKLYLANIMWLLLAFFISSYSIMIAVKMPSLSFVPVVGSMCMLASQVFNRLGFHQLYRFMLTICPMFAVYTYHLGVVAAGNPPLPSSIAIILAFSTFPFILFHNREWLPLCSALFLGYLVLVSFRWTNSWVEIAGVDETSIRMGYYQEVSISVSFIILCSAVFSLTRVASRAQRQQEDLLREGEGKNLELLRKSKELEEHLQRLEVSQQEEQQRNWAAQGFTHFASVLRSNDNIKQLADELVLGLTKYMKANQGGLYLVEGEKEDLRLELKACYAYSRKKHRSKSIAPGEGLVGQCYLEKDTIYITDVPQGYTYITSGLGDATPANILIVPLIASDKIEGVMEFASFNKFSPHEVAFLEKLSVDIAATLNISRINALTRRLLDEAREQAEQMRSQEEEMRQNMEELAATQEEMQRKEQEYLRRIDELEDKLLQNA